jgi:hypothetical protein
MYMSDPIKSFRVFDCNIGYTAVDMQSELHVPSEQKTARRSMCVLIIRPQQRTSLVCCGLPVSMRLP